MPLIRALEKQSEVDLYEFETNEDGHAGYRLLASRMKTGHRTACERRVRQYLQRVS